MEYGPGVVLLCLLALAVAALDFGKVRGLPVVGPTIARVLDDTFGAGSVAHNHDGANSKLVTYSKPVVEAHTANDTLTAAESGSVHVSNASGAAVTFTLPAAVAGLEYFFVVNQAQECRIDPSGSETISLPSTGVPGAAGKYLTANAVGESVHLLCAVAGTWAVFGYTGTWTAEA